MGHELSEREQEILTLLATGASNKDIAAELGISPNTVKVHLRNVYTKIGVSTRSEATLYAVQAGLVHPSPIQETQNTPAPDETSVPKPKPFLQKILPLLGIMLLIAGIWWLQFQRRSSLSETAGSMAVETANFHRWKESSPLPEARSAMAAAVYEGQFFLIGGKSPDGVTDSVLVYQPEIDLWSENQAKPTAAFNIQAAVIGEKIYVPGGLDHSGQPISKLESFDPRANQWESAADLPVALSSYGMTAFEGRLYLFGGWDGAAYRSEAYRYDPDEDQWSSISALPEARGGMSVVADESKILLIGGTNGTSDFADVWAYYPQRDLQGENAWEKLASLPETRTEMNAVKLAGILYLIGGEQTKPSTGEGMEPLQYRLMENQWSSFEAPIQPIGSGAALLAYGDLLHSFGGKFEAELSAQHQSYQAIYSRAIPLAAP